jgi:hypothetical protein
MENEDVSGIVFKKARENGLVISRIPKNTRDTFISIAENAFADDYGLTLKWCLDQAIEYQSMKELLFSKLSNDITEIKDMLSGQVQEDESGMKTINLISGKKIKLNGGTK